MGFQVRSYEGPKKSAPLLTKERRGDSLQGITLMPGAKLMRY
jgi:hypothetical protein